MGVTRDQDSSLPTLRKGTKVSKRTSGIDDLVTTLVKQHGVHKAINIAHSHLGTKLNETREFIWTCTLMKLRDIRDLRY
jgi:hypothetical protein